MLNIVIKYKKKKNVINITLLGLTKYKICPQKGAEAPPLTKGKLFLCISGQIRPLALYCCSSELCYW